MRLNRRGGTGNLLGWSKWCKTQGNSYWQRFLLETTLPMHQEHGFLAESTGYYDNWYSTCRNGISRFLCACYNVNPPNPQRKCDSFLQTFSVRRTLSYINVGIVVIRHNYICDDIIHISRQAFSPNCICGEPLIHQGCSRSDGGGVSNKGIII